jgi:membrane-bound lytic murein transglycosylase
VRPAVESPKNTVQTLIQYDTEGLGSSKESLFHRLCNLTTLSPEEAKAEMVRHLAFYANSGNLFNSETDILNAHAGYKPFYDWTISVQTETKSTVTNKLETLTGLSLADIVANDTKQMILWDNYFYQLLHQQNTAILQLLTELIRVYAIAKELKNSTGESINSLERANIVLPQCISSLLALRNWQASANVDADASNDETNEVAKPVFSLEELNIAKAEITQEIKNRVVSNEEADTTENVLSGNVHIQEAQWNGFSEVTRDILDTSKVGVERNTMQQALAAINQQITSYYQDVIGNAKTKTRLVQIGGGLIEVDTEKTQPKAQFNPESTNTNDPFDFSIAYGGFWGTSVDKEALLDIQIGDFKRVEQEVKQYVPGEVAHIENILQGETKVRETRRLVKSETSEYYEAITSEENERDVQTTDRFEMEKETESIIKSDTEIEAGLSATLDYGVVKINSNAGFSSSISTQNANKQATEYAKNITERARNKIVKKVTERRSTKITREFEDQNKHELTATDSNVVGIYRYVDKIYKTSLLNYGRRLMIKFNVIEPAAFYKFSQTKNPFQDIIFPKAPGDVTVRDAQGNSIALTSHDVINENNYQVWAKEYNASVNPPPKASIILGTSINDTTQNGEAGSGPGPKNTSFRISTGEKTTLVVPKSYEAKKAFARADFSSEGPTKPNGTYAGAPNATIYIGHQKLYFEAGVNNSPGPNATSFTFAGRDQLAYDEISFYSDQDRNLPITYKVDRSDYFYANILVYCELTDEALEQWKKETYEAILSAYQNLLAEAEYAKRQIEVEVGVQIKGKNPLSNRKIILSELKKQCIDNIRLYTQPLLGHKLNQIPNYLDYSLPNGEPDIDIYNYFDYLKHGRYIDAIESYFEWDNTTYEFHDYFWGAHENWVSLINQEDVDPLFENFLKAGSCSVVVPVRPGYEKLFLHHLKTGNIWLGGDVPLVDKLDEYIDNELGNVDPDAEPICESCWETKVPTNLAILQKQDGGIDETGLPDFNIQCDC